MSRRMRLPFSLAMILSGSIFAGTGALAQSYPAKPIRFIVPFPPGGGADLNARAVAQKMSEGLGQPVVIESRAGAGGNIGTEFVARAPADGYTLLFGTNGIAIQQHLRKLNWDPVRDFSPVSLISTYPLVLALHPSVPAQTVAELVSYAKANPGKLTYGSSGAGAPLHLGTELFKSAVGVDIVHVPYKGNAPMTAAILAGEVSLVFDSMTGPLPHIRAGKLRALAVTSPKRTTQLPEIPTISETVASGFAYEAWNGVLAPAGTPREIVQRLAAEVATAVASPDVRERLIGAGYDPISTTPEALGARLADDVERFGKVIREAGIKVD